MAAVENSDVIRGIICVESSGWPDADKINSMTVGNKPWLLVLGDFIQETPRWKSARFSTELMCRRINHAQGKAELVLLPDVGFSGATHMVIMDENSWDIAEWLAEWIKEHY